MKNKRKAVIGFGMVYGGAASREEESSLLDFFTFFYFYLIAFLIKKFNI